MDKDLYKLIRRIIYQHLNKQITEGEIQKALKQSDTRLNNKEMQI